MSLKLLPRFPFSASGCWPARVRDGTGTSQEFISLQQSGQGPHLLACYKLKVIFGFYRHCHSLAHVLILRLQSQKQPVKSFS